jgi:5-methylcytosine-specific restriction enzyme A
MSASRTMPGGSADRDHLERGPNGRALCRWCSLEVPSGRFTFCSDWCVHEWRLRTNPGYLREQVFQRDRGLCEICRVDTYAAYIELKRSRAMHRQKLLARWGLKRMIRKSLWDADHIIPVVEGGGECDLANLRTLCLICHQKQTAELRRRLLQQASADCSQSE